MIALFQAWVYHVLQVSGLWIGYITFSILYLTFIPDFRMLRLDLDVYSGGTRMIGPEPDKGPENTTEGEILVKEENNSAAEELVDELEKNNV